MNKYNLFRALLSYKVTRMTSPHTALPCQVSGIRSVSLRQPRRPTGHLAPFFLDAVSGTGRSSFEQRTEIPCCRADNQKASFVYRFHVEEQRRNAPNQAD